MGSEHIATGILNIVLVLIFAKIFGELAERIGQPPVLGELIAGVFLGASVLGWVEIDHALLLLAELGAILLLFEIGLESDVEEFLRVGPSALLVALIGVVAPFVTGYLAAAYIFHFSTIVSIFIGATLTATSVGVTARTLTDLGRLRTPEAQIILGAAVIDDVLGLIILAVVSGLAVTGTVSVLGISQIAILAIAFLVGAILLGIPLAPRMLRLARHLRTRGILTISAFLFALVLAFIADELRLATIVGAFAAGLVLARTEDLTHIQQRMKPIADILVPIFFVVLGIRVQLDVFDIRNPEAISIILLILILTAIAVAMKLISGFGVLRKSVNRIVVGTGMVPRGEVGFIFASIGLARGIIDTAEYAGIVAVIILTTFFTPPMLKLIISKESPNGTSTRKESITISDSTE